MTSFTTSEPSTFTNFPPVLDGKLSVVLFLESATDLVKKVEMLGKVFAPVRYDMQGNIDKIKANYEYDQNLCLFTLMQEEINSGKIRGAEAVLWLNRALLFFEIVFQQVLIHIQDKNINVTTKKILTFAYEGSVKKYHNWLTQQIFVVICKMSPNLPEVLKSIEVYNNLHKFEHDLIAFNKSIQEVRSHIDEYFKSRNLFI